MKILQYLQKQIKSPSKMGFLISAAIHLVAIALIFGSLKSMEVKQNGVNQVTMSLASIDTSAVQKTHSTAAPKPKTKPKPKPKPKPTPKKPAPKPVKEEPEVKPEEDVKEVSQQDTPDEKQEASNTTSEGAQAEALAYNEGVSDEFLAKIQSAISKKNKYPRIARIRGLEGEVIIEFILNEDGSMQGLKIIQSTAGDILNDNALKAVLSASKDFPLPKQRVRIKIPIAYTLRS
ncbi:hypothetical protein BKH46_04400 [Helicobacter sp. 12S02634-8]|uniref:energy transducer TonB n=1 Tax=Helicobacter sp. 12S02634-8 TaxID=1476199 RepID=UPI000BA5B491|nr:energy transducer TonB [Helicobacter sp. 12S02634-8]PAF47329.1 hypothetical protein BKH46_04400 [Helicobacter sp. 12S02634-8]